MGRLFLIDLEGDYYSCKHCQTPLALAQHLISRPPGFHWIFSEVVNVSFGEREEDLMVLEGLPSTRMDAFCVKCESKVGWKFESDHVEAPGYRFNLERSKILEPGEDPNMPPPPPQDA
ncbi:hypothetical protein KIW84_034215 [Lathyrus oleraceus]|uniref:Protein yippee-like n=1 Tax=Pisum sativum TaxID=3888 RepID=A0A9D5B445_PEA|nr:hypothetical protein KIW84_034215 [Pisum sativum]